MLTGGAIHTLPARAYPKTRVHFSRTALLRGMLRHRWRLGGRRRRLMRRRIRNVDRQLDRQPDGEAGTFALLARDLDPAAMQIGHHLHEVEPDAGPDDAGDIAAAVIALKQSIEIARRNPDSVVGDGNDDIAVGGGGADLDRAAARRIFERVGKQVAVHLEQELLVAPYRQ